MAKRIKEFMSVEDIIRIMSEENLGAYCCLKLMFEDNPTSWHDKMGFFDGMGIYSWMIYKFWNDCCGRDMDKLNSTIQYIKESNISRLDVHLNLQQSYSLPFI